MRSLIVSVALIGLLALWSCVLKADAFDPHQAFAKGAWELSVESGYGEQVNLGDATITELEFFNAGLRLGFFPWGIRGSGPLRERWRLGSSPSISASSIRSMPTSPGLPR